MSTGRVICYCPKPELQLGNVWNAKFSILFSCLFRLNVCCVVMMEKYFWDSPHLSVSNIVRQASNRRSHLRPTSQRRRIFMIQIQWRQ